MTAPRQGLTLPLCACCGWPAIPRVLAGDGDASLCLVCQVAGCTAEAVGPGVEAPETHRFVRESLARGADSQPARMAAARSRIAAAREYRNSTVTAEQAERAARMLADFWLVGERHGIVPDAWPRVTDLPTVTLDAVIWQDATGEAG